MNKYTGIIGCGAMGEALIAPLQLRNSGRIIVSSRRLDRLIQLKERHNVEVTTNNRLISFQSRELYLCVKPSQAEGLCSELRGSLRGDTLVVSVMAGVPIKSINKWLDHSNVIKIMPTITVGEDGPIAISSHTSTRLSLHPKNLLHMTEDQVDLATAVSGCMPGFLSYLLQELIWAAVSRGMEQHVAESLILRNLTALAAKGPQTVNDLIWIQTQVCSKGGATEKGIEAFKQGQGIHGMIAAADERVKDLRKSFD